MTIAAPPALFLAPATGEQPMPAPRAIDSGEPAMRRLRHPFSVVTDPAPHRTICR
jgi:hypothetical protein